jgi:hypothetical protein
LFFKYFFLNYLFADRFVCGAHVDEPLTPPLCNSGDFIPALISSSVDLPTVSSPVQSDAGLPARAVSAPSPPKFTAEWASLTRHLADHPGGLHSMKYTLPWLHEFHKKGLDISRLPASMEQYKSILTKVSLKVLLVLRISLTLLLKYRVFSGKSIG